MQHPHRSEIVPEGSRAKEASSAFMFSERSKLGQNINVFHDTGSHDERELLKLLSQVEKVLAPHDRLRSKYSLC